LKALVTPLKEMVTGKSDRLLWPMLATIGTVLLIVCVNPGNLMLVRAAREAAIRRALGALSISWRHLVKTCKQWKIEHFSPRPETALGARGR